MTTLTSRKAVRQGVATVLENVTTLVAVYDHETKDFERKSPVAMVHSDGTRTTFPGYGREYHALIITLLWARTDGDATEDYLDDLAQEVRQELLDNAETANWEDLQFDDELSAMDYPIIDGIMYRRETFRVTAFVVCG